MANEYKQTPEGKKTRDEGQKWLNRLKEAEKLEDKWLKDADRAVKVYSCEGPGDARDTSEYDFNILFSNVETIVPAIINSPPAPDIRRRFGDDDPAAKDFSELIERAISVQVDDSKLQTELEACAQDAFLAGRGIVRLRFKSDITEDQNEEIKKLAEANMSSEHGGDMAESGPYDGKESSKNAEGLPQETISNERITFEAVSWRDYRHGPAKRWEDRPWEAFRHSMPHEEVTDFQDATLVGGQMTNDDRMAQGESDSDIVVWEFWCKKEKTVKFIAETTGIILKSIDDPLELSGFYAIAQPVQPVEVTGRLMPINPFTVYRRLADELDETTRRINVLVNAMKVKGWYAGDATDLDTAISLDDDEFTPITNAEMWASHGGIEKAIAFWPIETYARALKELYAARDQTKQSIYEITGISDIVRGASKASETLGAQEIKSQWGNLRIQKAQRAMARCARDLFVMMSEIIPTKFTAETLEKMTGIHIIAKPGMDEEAMQKAAGVQRMMNERVATYYRVDVETDSTAKADLTRQKQEVSEFLQGSGAYFQAVGPLVAEGTIPAEMAIEIYASNARMFNLGKTTEDAIDSMVQKARKQAEQPQQEQPDPEQIKAQADMAMEQQRAQAEAQKTQMDMRIKEMEARNNMQQAEIDFAAQSQELQGKMQIEMAKVEGAGQKAQNDAAIAVMNERMKALDLEMKEVDLQIKRKELEIKDEDTSKKENENDT